VHKGLFPPSVEKRFPHLLPYCDVRDVGRAARDWPQLNFIVYHSAYRFAAGGRVEDAWAQFEKTGRIEWVTDLAEIPARYGVTNVYGDLGQIFAQSTVADPRVCAAMMGQLIKGLGVDRVVWGSDAVWTGSPQWQIEALRRLEIPEDMQKKYGFAPLGAADGPIKSAILGETNARLYTYERRAALAADRVAALKPSTSRRGRRAATCATAMSCRRGVERKPSRQAVGMKVAGGNDAAAVRGDSRPRPRLAGFPTPGEPGWLGGPCFLHERPCERGMRDPRRSPGRHLRGPARHEGHDVRRGSFASRGGPLGSQGPPSHHPGRPLDAAPGISRMSGLLLRADHVIE
jgi:hypothetical protein